MKPIGIDLFSGAGGFSLGFEQAGFRIAAAVEVDPVHCAVHSYNFPETAIIPCSVVGLSAKTIREKAGIGTREVDCVFGGAPCQGFSLIGHRVLDDPRNRLVLEFVRLVTDLGARSFVFENVKGLTVGKHKTFLHQLIDAFDSAGYSVRVPWKVLNAGNYGTPQSRERLILLGVRKGETLPDYPEPSTNLAGRKPQFDGLPDGPSCFDALGDLPDADRFDELLGSDTVDDVQYGSPSAYASELRCLTNDAWHHGHPRIWAPALLTSSARTMHTEISRFRFAETKPGMVEPVSRFFKLPKDGVSNTLRAGTDGSRGAFTSPRPIHFSHNRCITVREMARLHGFPDWFRFHVTKWHGARQIGNAVPPPLARAVAGEMLKALKIKSELSGDAMSLGDSSLLALDVTGAAKYFNVEAPATRRDKKSGARKRSQLDVERERAGGLFSHA